MSVHVGCIAMVACGPVDRGIQEHLRDGLEAAFGLPVCVTGQELPLSGWNAERRQFLGTALLAEARKGLMPAAVRVLALTEADLYSDDTNFIFGQADVAGPAAVVSLHRLHPEFYGRPPGSDLFTRRAQVECTHELGHTFGLGHCPRPECVMCFSDHIEETDRKGAGFCPAHAQELETALRQLSTCGAQSRPGALCPPADGTREGPVSLEMGHRTQQ